MTSMKLEEAQLSVMERDFQSFVPAALSIIHTQSKWLEFKPIKAAQPYVALFLYD